MAEFIGISDIIGQSELKRIQEEYCKISNVVTICLDDQLNIIHACGELTGITEDSDWSSQIMASEMIGELVDAVGGDSIEDVSFLRAEPEEMPEGLWLGAMSIRLKGKIISYWIVAATGYFSEGEFADRLDLLRDTCSALYSGRVFQIDAELESLKSNNAKEEIIQAYHTLEATTQILQLLDNNSRSEAVMLQWLQIVRDYINSEYAQIIRVEDSGEKMEVIAEVHRQGMMPAFREREVNAYSFANSDAPLIVSSESVGKAENKDIADAGITALVLLPLVRRQDGSGMMYASIEYRCGDHSWSRDELKFISDAIRVIQSHILARINKNSLAGSLRALEEILNNVGAAVYLTSNINGKVLFYNRMLMETFGEEWENGRLQLMISNGANFSSSECSFEIFNARSSNWYDVSYKPVEWVDGTEAILYSMTNITDHKLYQRKIERQAFTDFLTGLYNRMCCERDLARLVDATKRDGSSGALIYLDLDDFKHINDGIGHQYGDVLLKNIANAMRGVRGIENTCYRMGGDEFVILVPPAAYPRLDGILEDIKNIFSSPWYLKDADYYCTTSIGIVTFPKHGDSVPDLIKKADIAMYEAKKSGKNRMASYSEGQDSTSGRRLDMEKNMRDAENSDYEEFLVYYQPIIDAESDGKRCLGAEALVRWDSEQMGFMSPVDFIPLAEYLGLVNPIGQHVLVKACKTCKKWNDKGFDYMKVNVNLSVVQLLQNNIVELVEEAIDISGINPKNLTLEVTESLAINDMARMIGILSRIKALGVSIALDDFGTGYSSLNHIREIPFDVIKVDQSFVKDLAENAYSQAFVKMVAELAETIGVKICVEGIETEAQYDVVKQFKIKYLQGYLFDKPLTQKDFENKYINNQEPIK